MNASGAAHEAGCTLALDQGSHSSRAVLFDAFGNELSSARVPVSLQCADSDRVEQDPLELLASLRSAMADACNDRSPVEPAITSAGLATQRSTIVCWERSSGRPLTPAISWQDRRNAAWLAELGASAGRVRALIGLPLSPHYGASKLRWCLDHVPAVASAAAVDDLAAGPLSSYLSGSLTDTLTDDEAARVDPANASRTLLFDPRSLDWSPELLDLFGVPRPTLPRCVPTWHDYGTLRIGERRVPLAVCTGDQSAAAFAFGTPDPDVALVNVGTGAFIQRAVPADAPLPDGLLRSVLCADGSGVLYSHEGTVNGAASALDWLGSTTALDIERALATPLPTATPAEPPLFMNGVGGLGSPFWLPAFPVEFVGEGDEAARLIAVIESIAFLVCVNLEALHGSAPLRRIQISGGLARSDLLCRLIADHSGLPVLRHALPEATARGVAYLAAGRPDRWRPVPVERSFAPSHNATLAARELRWRQQMARRGARFPAAPPGRR